MNSVIYWHHSLCFRFLIDSRWFKQWKKYVGFDSWDMYIVGERSLFPGPIDNSGLFSGTCSYLFWRILDCKGTLCKIFAYKSSHLHINMQLVDIHIYTYIYLNTESSLQTHLCWITFFFLHLLSVVKQIAFVYEL